MHPENVDFPALKATDLLSLAECRIDALQKALAETERELNSTRQSVSRVIQANLYNISALASMFLPIRDGLEKAMSNQAAGVPAYRDDIVMLLRHLEKSFERAGIAEINPAVGERFDPDRHAVERGHTRNPFKTRIGKVVQKGFQFESRVLRPALVMLG